MIALPDMLTYMRMIWNILTWDSSKKWLISMIISFFTSYNILMLSLPIAVFHTVRNNTLVETKFFFNKMDRRFNNPYNLGLFRNWNQLMGDRVIGWILPLPNSNQEDKFFRLEDEIFAVTYWPIVENYSNFATNRAIEKFKMDRIEKAAMIDEINQV